MLNFKNYITEAKVSKRNLDKVADIFKRIVEKNLKTKLFRFGGPKGFCEINRGIGILYFYSRNKAIRLNYVGNEITSITLWDKYVLDQPGDITVDLDGLGLLQAGKELISIIRNPRTGTVKTLGGLDEGREPNSSEARQYMYEASRVSPLEFAQMAQEMLPRDEDLNRVSWDTIKDIADQKDVLVPSVIRKETVVPGTRGKNKRFNLQQLIIGDVSDDVDKPAKETEKVYYLKLTAQDTLTKKFTSVKGDKEAEKMLKRAGKALSQPNVSAEMEHPDTLFGKMRNLVQVVVRGTRNALVIYGGPGIGKTFVVNKTVEEEGLQKNRDYYVIKGKITTTSLYQTLFMHREGSLLIFDDTDSCVGNTVLNTSIGNIKIENLYEVIEKMGYVGVKNDDETQFVLRPKSEDIDVLSYNGENAEMKKINYIMKHKVSKPMYRIVTGDDEVTVTEDHSCMVYRDGNLISVKPFEIKQTDELVKNA